MRLLGCYCFVQKEFAANWEAMTGGLFQGFDWRNLFVAGGAPLACLLPNFISTGVAGSNGFFSSDIDVFVFGLDPQAAFGRMQAALEFLRAKSQGRGDVLVSQHSVTLLGLYPQRHIQFVLRCYSSPAEVLIGFDVDCCCVGYNGDKVCVQFAFCYRFFIHVSCADCSSFS
jgi:hypothetical protein